jgi:hypothetical protein
MQSSIFNWYKYVLMPIYYSSTVLVLRPPSVLHLPVYA